MRLSLNAVNSFDKPPQLNLITWTLRHIRVRACACISDQKGNVAGLSIYSCEVVRRAIGQERHPNAPNVYGVRSVYA
jgi:hypothetical protein